MSGLRIEWNSPGPVCEAFMASTETVKAIMGPVGSGKTSGVFMNLIQFAQRQRPSTRDGIRKFKATVVRDTYRQLWRTTIKSWWKWVPQSTGKWNGGKNEPCSHELEFDLPDGTRLEFTVEFIAIGDADVEDVLRGYEPTVFYLNEADLLAHEVFTYALTRLGRFPAMDEGGPTFTGILLDFNAPDITNWVYDVFVENRERGVGFYRQPSGLSPQAENLKNLKSGYYELLMIGMEEWAVRRFIRNEFGYSRDGKPVFPEFNDMLHVAGEDLVPVKALDLLVGFDAGMSPAAVIRQRMPNGQWRAYDELVSEQGTGPHRFGDDFNRLLAERYPEWAPYPERIKAACDPSAFYGDDEQSEEKLSWVGIVGDKTQLEIEAAPSNLLTPRLAAVRETFTGALIDGRYPRNLISPRCKFLIKGYAADYRFKKIQLPGENRFHEKPDKNAASHVADADQYAILTHGEYDSLRAREHARDDMPLQTTAELVDGSDGYGRQHDDDWRVRDPRF